MDTLYAKSPIPELEILSCSNDRQFAPHLHDGYVLWLNSAAGEHFQVKGASDILLPGSISIIEPGVVHANRPCSPERRHLRSFYFSEQFLVNMSERIFGDGRWSVLPTSVLTDRTLWREFVVLHEHLLHSTSSFQAEEAIVSGFGCLLTSRKGLRAGEAGAVDGWRMRRVMEYFTAHIDRQFTLEEVATEVQCTSFHLIRLFRAAKGVAPHTYLIQLRLEHARKLLADGSSIVDAALRSGFADQSHLTRLFKTRFGVTPGKYLRQRRGR